MDRFASYVVIQGYIVPENLNNSAQHAIACGNGWTAKMCAFFARWRGR
jgi:hypothetical protein